MASKKIKIQAYVSEGTAKLLSDEADKRSISRQKIVEDALTRYFEAKTLAELMPGFLTNAILNIRRDEQTTSKLIATLTEPSAEDTEEAA